VSIACSRNLSRFNIAENPAAYEELEADNRHLFDLAGQDPQAAARAERLAEKSDRLLDGGVGAMRLAEGVQHHEVVDDPRGGAWPQLRLHPFARPGQDRRARC
jgi:hypothetical protein